jgi:hypothetical protein
MTIFHPRTIHRLTKLAVCLAKSSNLNQPRFPDLSIENPNQGSPSGWDLLFRRGHKVPQEILTVFRTSRAESESATATSELSDLTFSGKIIASPSKLLTKSKGHQRSLHHQSVCCSKLAVSYCLPLELLKLWTDLTLQLEPTNSRKTKSNRLWPYITMLEATRPGLVEVFFKKEYCSPQVSRLGGLNPTVSAKPP